MTIFRPHPVAIPRDSLRLGLILYAQVGPAMVVTRADRSLTAGWVAVELCNIERIDGWVQLGREAFCMSPDSLLTLRPGDSITTWLTADEHQAGVEVWRQHLHTAFLAAFQGRGKLPRMDPTRRYLRTP